MNDEELTRALEKLPPAEPNVDGWAKRARRRSQARRGVAVAAVLLVGLGVPGAHLANNWYTGLTQTPVAPEVLATPTHTPELPSGAPLPPTPPTPHAVLELTGVVAVRSEDGTGEPTLCGGIVEYSETGSPPKCQGPALRGDFSWEDVDYREQDGIRWTDQTYRVYGYFDPEDGPSGSFTLSRPIAPGEPEAVHWDEIRRTLCDDPYRGSSLEKLPGVPSVPRDEPESREPFSLEESANLLEVREPEAEWWVDDIVGALNVVFLGYPEDAEELHSALREITDGPLCVVAAEPKEVEEVRRNLEEYFETRIGPPNLQHVDASLLSGPVTVGVWHVDDTLAGWLGELGMAPEDGIEIRVLPILHPVGESGDPIVVYTR